MPPRKRARAAASSATIACDRSAIVLKQSSAIGAIYEAGELCDGEVKLGQQTYKVSRMVLASASPFFKAAFSAPAKKGAAPTCSVRHRGFSAKLGEKINKLDK